MNWHYTIKFSSKSIRELSYPNYWMNWLDKLKHCILECCALFYCWIKKANIYTMAQHPVYRTFIIRPLMAWQLARAWALVERRRIGVNESSLKIYSNILIGKRSVIWQGWPISNPAGHNPLKTAKVRRLGHSRSIIDSPHYQQMQKSP